MWSARLGGTTLHFVYAASNNQNFVMRDVETGTWWQQVTGEGIIGPRRGEQLEPFPWQEIGYGIFRREHPEGLVLQPDPALMSRYPFARYRRSETEQARGRPIPRWFEPDPDVALEHHDLVVSVQIAGRAKAYPMALLLQQNPIQDLFAGRRILLLVAADGKSVRAFDRATDAGVLDLYRLPEQPPEPGAPEQPAGLPEASGRLETPVLIDAQTGSHWDFSGQAIAGELAGTRLRPLQTLRDYWFDWRRHHPEDPVYLPR